MNSTIITYNILKQDFQKHEWNKISLPKEATLYPKWLIAHKLLMCMSNFKVTWKSAVLRYSTMHINMVTEQHIMTNIGIIWHYICTCLQLCNSVHSKLPARYFYPPHPGLSADWWVWSLAHTLSYPSVNYSPCAAQTEEETRGNPIIKGCSWFSQAVNSMMDLVSSASSL